MFAPLVANSRPAPRESSIVAKRRQDGFANATKTTLHSRANALTRRDKPGLDLTKIPVFSPGKDDHVSVSTAYPNLGRTGLVHSNLRLGAVDDPLEHEADRVAEGVMRVPEGTAFPSISIGAAQQPKQVADEVGVVLGKAASGFAASLGVATKHIDTVGKPLEARTRAFFEPRFGYDFSRVKVHTDGEAATSAASVNSNAYTVGNHIFFGCGKYQPDAVGAQKLIAHELTHVIQQSRSSRHLVRRDSTGRSAADKTSPLTEDQMAEIELKYRFVAKTNLFDLPVGEFRELTEKEKATTQSRIRKLMEIRQSLNAAGDRDAGILDHVIGTLRSLLLIDKRLRETGLGEDLKRQKELSQGERNYESMINNHPEWRLKNNAVSFLTDQIFQDSQSADVSIFQSSVVGGITDMGMGGGLVTEEPIPSPPVPRTIASRIAAFTGTRGQYRAYVLAKLKAEPNNPLRFLLNAAGTDFKKIGSRVHSDLADNPDIWEAGHIASDKIGGIRLMIQIAHENQLQNISVEHPRVGGAVLGNPAIEVGGFHLSKATALTWETIGFLRPGTAASAPIVE